MVQEYSSPDAGSESAHSTPTTDGRAREELKRYLDAAPDGRSQNPYLQVHMAQIKEVERDDQGRFTGYATVELLTMVKNSIRVSVLLPIPSSQYWFQGALPPPDTLCSVGFMPQGLAVILNYYPPAYRVLVQEKGLRELALGEVFLQAEVTESSVRRAGATILLDRDGRVEIKDKDARTRIVLDADGNVTIDSDTKVVVNCDDVHIGGESGQELVTKSFLTDVFDSHTHAGVQSGASTTGPPTPSGGSNHTIKTKAE